MARCRSNLEHQELSLGRAGPAIGSGEGHLDGAEDREGKADFSAKVCCQPA